MTVTLKLTEIEADTLLGWALEGQASAEDRMEDGETGDMRYRAGTHAITKLARAIP